MKKVYRVLANVPRNSHCGETIRLSFPDYFLKRRRNNVSWKEVMHRVNRFES
jgi:hypothetical protein